MCLSVEREIERTVFTGNEVSVGASLPLMTDEEVPSEFRVTNDRYGVPVSTN